MTFRNAFLDWAIVRFPELTSEIQGESRQMRIHLAFTLFRERTQQAIDNEYRTETLEYFQMADRVLAKAFLKMRSLFHVIYVEHLRFDDRVGNRSWALAYLTPRLKARFISSLACSSKLRDQLRLTR